MGTLPDPIGPWESVCIINNGALLNVGRHHIMAARSFTSHSVHSAFSPTTSQLLINVKFNINGSSGLMLWLVLVAGLKLLMSGLYGTLVDELPEEPLKKQVVPVELSNSQL